ncbi:response regulator [Variovorax boronicumulans]|uniref:response regulator n=1 Tax=Variovorax boronicumulans TaxID=436515 RepID=UPI0033966850
MPLAVFLVEDEPTIQDSLKVVLEGYLRAEIIGTAPSEAEASAWLAENPEAWDILVVDLLLRQGSGLGVLAAVAAAGRKGRKGCMVVALTNAASADNRAQCLSLGADAVFDKTEEIDEFLAFCAEGVS